MKKIIAATVLFLMFAPVLGNCREKKELFSLVEALGIQRQGYTLCAALTPEQQAFARNHMQETSAKKVYRFQDKSLNIVADSETNRVLVMFEQFEKITPQKVQDLVGELFMSYGAPTVSAHNKIVYWAWGETAPYTDVQYNSAKENKEKLEIFATLKLSSEINVSGKNSSEANNTMEDSETAKTGGAYYIFSSPPLLQFFHEE